MGRRGAIVLLVVAALLAGCGDDDDSGDTAKVDTAEQADLKQELLPRSFASGYKFKESFVLESATDWIGPPRGVFIPESTLQSKAVKTVEDAGFEGGAKVAFTGRNSDLDVWVGRFSSADGAEKMRDFLHAEDLKQPCAGPCVVAPRAMAVGGIPSALGAHHKPLDNPPPGARGEPVENYSVEFTVGPLLYAIYQGGKPGGVKPGATAELARRYYARVR
jgi:hypothetical protein